MSEHEGRGEDEPMRQEERQPATTGPRSSTEPKGQTVTQMRFAPLERETERVVRDVIGAGLRVHRELGPGFLEPVYERALQFELRCRGLLYDDQHRIDIFYRGEQIGLQRLDLVIEGCVVVEVKAVREIRPIHQAQILSYLKASGMRVGLLMNFNVARLVDGLQRFVR